MAINSAQKTMVQLQLALKVLLELGGTLTVPIPVSMADILEKVNHLVTTKEFTGIIGAIVGLTH